MALFKGFSEFSEWRAELEVRKASDGNEELEVQETQIPGLRIFKIPVFSDSRGWFKENWQAERFNSLGLRLFRPVQHNVSSNLTMGTTRGFHAEPWDKLASVLRGSVFSAWVDLREGPTYGTVVQLQIGIGSTAFIPRGVANSFQTLEDDTVYSYLVNDHWRPTDKYPAIALDDKDLNINWPIPLDSATISAKDLQNPPFADLTATPAPRPLIIGSTGQLALALSEVFPESTRLSSKDFRLGESNLEEVITRARIDTKSISAVLNAAAYTNVEHAETQEGRPQAWTANVLGVRELANFSKAHGIPLVHISSDYVFDGKSQDSYSESDYANPINFYGFTKAAGDAIVEQLEKHYILRTSWVIGDGNNFVKTMRRLALNGVSPNVVDDQTGRLTFTDDLAQAIRHLLTHNCEPGTYNFSGLGEPRSWAEWAKLIFVFQGRDPNDVRGINTNEYNSAIQTALRPANSTLELKKIIASGYTPVDAASALQKYLGDLEISQNVP